MLLVIPSIDLSRGKCLGCIDGEFGTIDYYQRLFDNPLTLVKLLRDENSKALHINDIDCLSGIDIEANIHIITEICSNFDIPIQLYSRFLDIHTCKFMLDSGIYRLIIDKVDDSNIMAVESLILSYTYSRVVFLCILDESNKLKNANIPLDDYLKNLKNIGANRIIVKYDDLQVNSLRLDFLKTLSSFYNLRITLYEGIYNTQDLLELNKLTYSGIDSIIMSEALYRNCFPCQKIWRLAEAKLIN